jgi:hypothetical protein
MQYPTRFGNEKGEELLVPTFFPYNNMSQTGATGIQPL